MAFNYTLPLRVVQAILAILVLALTGYGEFTNASNPTATPNSSPADPS